ncbi:hypothetical protein DZF72_23950 [Vibrio parahaemolyticus]|nr:hypothetical protein [Vibrio parahaemolyticus]MBE4202816.1 hypothetical protein [Vibrio parahaemolyticus]
MKDFLMVIESDWKVYRLTQILNELGCSNFKVISTRGHIRDLPSDRMAVNLETFERDEIYLDEHLLSKIVEDSKKYEKTIICTDDDTEGEKIAFDLAREIKNKYQRTSIKEMTTESVMQSLNNSREINQSMVNEHISKRIVDRVIGFELSVRDVNNRAEIGRVVTPLLSYIDKNAQKSGVIFKNIKSDGINVKLIFDCYELDAETIAGITECLSGMTSLELVKTSEKEKHDQSTLWNGKQAMVNIASSLNMKVSEVFKHLQDLYAQGMISYFRTDSCSVSDEDAAKLINLAMEFGINTDASHAIRSRSDKGTERLSKVERIQHSHGALIPLSTKIDPFAPLQSLSSRDQVYSVLLRHTLKVIKKPAIIREINFKPDLSSALNKPFFDLVSKYRDKIKYKFVSRTIKGIDRPEFPYYPEILPNGVNFGIKKNSDDCGYRLIQKDLMIALLMTRHGLGRPSTFALHSERISKRYIDNTNCITFHAKESLLKAKQEAPLLCELETYHELDKLFSDEGKTIAERISLSLEMLERKETKEGQETKKSKSSEISPFR